VSGFGTPGVFGLLNARALLRAAMTAASTPHFTWVLAKSLASAWLGPIVRVSAGQKFGNCGKNFRRFQRIGVCCVNELEGSVDSARPE